MKKILIITPGFLPLLGGMEEQANLLGGEFRKKGYSVEILTEKSRQSFPSKEIINDLIVKRVGFAANRMFSLPFVFLSYIFHLLSNHYDLVIVRTFTLPSVATGLLKRLGLLKTTTVVTAETGGNNDDIELISKKPFSKFIYSIVKGNDYYNCICDDNYRHLLKRGFNKNKITRIYNGIDISCYSKARFKKKIKNFLFLGQIKMEKGVWELVRAFESPSIKNRLYIGGDGSEKKALEQYVKKKGLTKKIIFLGRITRDKKILFFKKGEACIFPSYSEGFGLVIYEAASYKKTIICTNVADIKKIFGDNVYYCKKRNVNSIKTIVNQIAHEKLKTPNYDVILKYADIKSVADQFLSLIPS